MRRPDIRNLAIVAHVDHGKTTLVDALLRQSGVFRANEQMVDRVMDSFALERERGITIMAKNTPSHGATRASISLILRAIRILAAKSSARFRWSTVCCCWWTPARGRCRRPVSCLKKALEARLPAILCINKIDRSDARPAEVLDEVYDLFIDLEANEDQLDFPCSTPTRGAARR